MSLMSRAYEVEQLVLQQHELNPRAEFAQGCLADTPNPMGDAIPTATSYFLGDCSSPLEEKCLSLVYFSWFMKHESASN